MKRPLPVSLLLAVPFLAACGSMPEEGIDANHPHVILVATRGDERVTALDAATYEVVGSTSLGLGAHELAGSSDGRLAVGAAYGGPGQGHLPPDNRLAIWAPHTGELTAVVDLGEHQRPNDVAFHPDGRRVYVTSEQRGTLLVVDAIAGTLAHAWDLGDTTGHMLAYAPDAPSVHGDGRVYVSHVASGKVTAVDAGTGEILARLEAAFGAEGIGCTRDGSRVWCANNRSNSITILDGQTLTVLDTLDVPGFPFRVKASPDDALMAVSLPMANAVAVFDVETGEERHRVELADLGPQASPQGVAFGPRSERLHVACPGANVVVAIDLASGAITHRYLAGPMLDPITCCAW